MVEACQNLRQRVRGKRKMVEAKVSRGRKFLRRVGARIAAQQGALNRATAGGGRDVGVPRIRAAPRRDIRHY